MHIETLKMFCDLADILSFSKTAKKNMVTQSAISQQLAQMELKHRCQLIDRRKRPIELTKAGRLFYQAARDMLERYEQFKSQLNDLKSSTTTRVNVAAIYSIGMHSLPTYVKQFMVVHPNLHVHIEYFSAARIYQLVLAGEIDIGLVAVPKKDKRLGVYDFENEPLLLVCSPKHPWANKTSIDIHQLQFEKFVCFEKNVPTCCWINDILERYNIVVRPVMDFDNIETVKRAVEINSGISILPQPAIAQELASGTLKAVAFSNENFVRPTGILVRKDKILTQAARSFLELLRSKNQLQNP